MENRANSDDILGMEEKFRYLRLVLDITGAGGTVFFSYWNGSNWTEFTPEGGVYNFDSLDRQLVLWDDYLSIPSDWQKNGVNGVNLYWLKAEVRSSYTTAPRGSTITAKTTIKALNVRR